MISPVRFASARPTLAALALATSLITFPAAATPDARSAAEIDQLLSTVANSGCTFVRSGQEYSGTDARKHLEFKLGFVRSRIDSTEQFITYLASKSSTTGEPYHIRCAGNDTVAQTWLETQLKGIRSKH